MHGQLMHATPCRQPGTSHLSSPSSAHQSQPQPSSAPAEQLPRPPSIDSTTLTLSPARPCACEMQALAGSSDGMFMRLARHVHEASRQQLLRFQGVLVTGGVDEVRSGDGYKQRCGCGVCLGRWWQQMNRRPYSAGRDGYFAPHLLHSHHCFALFCSAGRDALLCGQHVPQRQGALLLQLLEGRRLPGAAAGEEAGLGAVLGWIGHIGYGS